MAGWEWWRRRWWVEGFQVEEGGRGEEQCCKPWWSTCSPQQGDRRWGEAGRWGRLCFRRGHHRRCALKRTRHIFTLLHGTLSFVLGLSTKQKPNKSRWTVADLAQNAKLAKGWCYVAWITDRLVDDFVFCLKAWPLDITVSNHVNQHDVAGWHHLQRVGGGPLTTLPVKEGQVEHKSGTITETEKGVCNRL